jgi:hypothetical protein
LNFRALTDEFRAEIVLKVRTDNVFEGLCRVNESEKNNFKEQEKGNSMYLFLQKHI